MREWFSRRIISGASATLVACAFAGSASAGPPFATDDPVPTDYGRWEIYDFVSASHVSGSTEGEAGIDLNYGAILDLQLTLVIPLAYEDTGDLETGMGTVEVAAKYRFMHQSDTSWQPDVAFFPRLFLDTADDGFGSGHTSILLPLWFGKDIGDWSVFGGGGYEINPGSGNKDFWTGGLAIMRPVTDRFDLGVEIYGRTRDADGGRSFAGVNVGGIYALTDHWSLMGSLGPGVHNASSEGRYAAYLALQSVY